MAICCGRSIATHFLQGKARAKESTTAEKKSREKYRLGVLNANKLTEVLKCYCKQHQSRNRAWPTRASCGSMFPGMTNQEHKQLTLTLYNHWYQHPSLSSISNRYEKNCLTLSKARFYNVFWNQSEPDLVQCYAHPV